MFFPQCSEKVRHYNVQCVCTYMRMQTCRTVLCNSRVYMYARFLFKEPLNFQVVKTLIQRCSLKTNVIESLLMIILPWKNGLGLQPIGQVWEIASNVPIARLLLRIAALEFIVGDADTYFARDAIRGQDFRDITANVWPRFARFVRDKWRKMIDYFTAATETRFVVNFVY